MDDCRLPAPALAAFAHKCFEATGMTPEHAETGAGMLVRADLRGISTHGVNRLPGYVKALRAGRINPRPALRVVRASGAGELVDGDGGLGHVVSAAAMEHCIARARRTGAAFSGVRNSRHNGAAGLYALMAAEAGMIGLSLTGGGVRVTPAGGREALLGTNPIAFAAPAGDEPILCLDMATSVVAGGKVEEHLLKGVPLRPGWALDPGGQPTTDPSLGNQGPLLPLGSTPELGSHKGYGLSLMVEVLCNLLTGCASGPEKARDLAPAGSGSGHFFAAIQVEAFQPLAEFRARLDANLRLVRGAALAEGCERILTPGELEWECERERRANGIPLHENTRAALRDLAAELGISPPPGC